MPNEKTDRRGGSTVAPDTERDLAGKEGPVTKSGNPDNKHAVPAPYNDDLQTQIAAKGNKNRNREKKEGDIESDERTA